MTIERASARLVPKPWGSPDLRPWNAYHGDGAPIGEIWFQRTDKQSPDSALLLKLLFTKEPLSIQVHPDDAFAHSVGLPHGKSEAWYVLSAAPEARVALGLTRRLSIAQLRKSVDEGSISNLVQWRAVRNDDVIFVPAGTIHAIGPGLVVMEIQQRSDATFRLFDYGRQRELHIDHAVAAASTGPVGQQTPARQLTTARTLLVVSAHFVLERFEFLPGSNWELLSAPETWLFVLDGRAQVGPIDAGTGEVIFFESHCMHIKVGPDGLQGLIAYAACEPIHDLLRSLYGEIAAVEAYGRERATVAAALAPPWAQA
ncbi:MAG: class I mannose-6-phosphate isomerase [Steroidobacteraceae bacterium]